jgi:hypothetical protein
MTTAMRLILAGTFTALLLGVVYASGDFAHTVASAAGFATAIALLGAAVVGWERVVTSAETAGLVELAD